MNHLGEGNSMRAMEGWMATPGGQPNKVTVTINNIAKKKMMKRRIILLRDGQLLDFFVSWNDGSSIQSLKQLLKGMEGAFDGLTLSCAVYLHFPKRASCVRVIQRLVFNCDSNPLVFHGPSRPGHRIFFYFSHLKLASRLLRLIPVKSSQANTRSKPDGR